MMFMLDKSKPLVVVSLFDGISCGLQALKNQGFKVKQYFASEVDKNAIKVSEANHPEIIRLGDVATVSFKNELLKSESGVWGVDTVDLILAGSPCQGFSFAGKQLNFNDPRSKLYFEFSRLLKECNSDYILENVRMKPEFEEIINHDLGLHPVKINSRLYTPQNRLRYYWSSLLKENFKERSDNANPHITSILEDGDYRGVWTWPRGYNKGGVREVDKIPCLTTSSWQHNFMVVRKDGTRRKFTPVEAERAQGLPDNYTSTLSENQRFIVLGNCWTVPVIEDILKQGVTLD